MVICWKYSYKPRRCKKEVTALFEINSADLEFCLLLKAWPHTRQNHTKSSIWHGKNQSHEKIWGNSKEIVFEKSQSTISTIRLVNRILVTVIISFLPRFSIWQFLFMDYLLCVAGHNERITHENSVILTSVRPGLRVY